MLIVSIVGARPQFIKIAPVSRVIAERNASSEESIEDLVLHTGQHYDPRMSEIFFDELNIAKPDINLAIGSGRHGRQTAAMLESIEEYLLKKTPDCVVVYGDTNSTLAGALAAVKLGLSVIHVESGLRSFRREMPEEINRVAVDHICDLLLAPTRTAIDNLENEGLGEKSVNTGDVMYDAVLYYRDLALSVSRNPVVAQVPPREYGVVTLHRAENTSSAVLGRALDVVNRVAEKYLELVFPMHPRTRAELERGGIDWAPHARVRLVEPLGYLDMIRLIEGAAFTLTDSGGVQKEALFLNCPCVTLRKETEWIETVAAGGNTITGLDWERVEESVQGIVSRLRAGERVSFERAAREHFGDGKAASKIVDQIVELVA
jgi:UDP-GlcNAc3NAcA epimerase